MSSDSTSNTNTSSSSSTDQPSMIGGHLKYVQGAVSSALGYESGEQTKNEAVQEMREAKDASDSDPPAQSTLLGKVESAAGNLAGCEGMQEEGKARVPQKAGIEETSGTG